MSRDYDVIVVGARVAGASTAMLLARRGHRVLMIDRSRMPSDTLSTHAILRTGVLQLTRWKLIEPLLEAETPPIRKVTLGFGAERVPFAVKPDYGIDTFYAPRRQILDSVLVDAAERSGAVFRERTTLVGLTRHKDRVTGVVVRGADGHETVSARIVIGADGAWSRVAELAGAQIYASHPASNAVSYAYYEGLDFDGFWFQFTPGVNAGLVPTNDGRCLVFAGRPASEWDRFRRDPNAEFTRLLRLAGDDLADRVAEARRVGGFRSTPGLPGFVRQPWGPGWALVGDSGYTKDPISAHGISDALRDAEICATAVDASLAQGSRDALARYQRLRDSLSMTMFDESRELARYRWDPEGASRRMRRISAAVRTECEALVAMSEASERERASVA